MRFFDYLSLCLALVAAPAAVAQNAGGRGQGANWIAAADTSAREFGVYHFRRAFDLPARPAAFAIRVTADNRYKLYVNGRLASLGPARGDALNWRYETVDIAPYLKAGRNLLAAVVWNFADQRPLAQISLRTGFLVQGETPAERVADTGTSWKAVRDLAYRPIPFPRGFQYGYYVVGPGEHVEAGAYPWGWEQPDFDDSAWKPAVSIGRPALREAASGEDWWLTPRTIPMMELTPERVGVVRRATGAQPPAAFPAQPAAFTIPAHAKAVILLDRTHLTTAYPELIVSGGKGAQVTLRYSEVLRFPGKKDPGNRNDIEGRQSEGNYDEFVADGGARRFYSTLWWRTWRYLEVTVDARDEPLVIEDLRSVYTGYPFERKARFDSDSPELAAMLDIGWRTARLCAHETYVDCPYYEQLQYVGDTRVQALISLFNTGDARLMRNAIELVDGTRTGDMITLSRAPSWVPQYIPGFSLMWIGMVHDYWMYRDDPDFVRRMLPGVRSVLAWFARLQKPGGSLNAVPFWDIVDNLERRMRLGDPEPGWAPIDLNLLLAYQWAADLEDGVGYKGLAREYRGEAARMKTALAALYLDPSRKLFADTPDRKTFSQPTNVMAILAGLVPPAEARAWIDRTIDDPGVVKSGLYFRYYLHLAANVAGAGDRFIDLLDPWRRMLGRGLTTWSEFDASDSRSDCHAWSASPNVEIFRTILGVDSSAPGFQRVIVRPFLGKLTRASGAVPHPKGEIAVSLALRSGKLEAEVGLPPGIDGDFVWKGESRPLRPGQNKLTF